MSHQPMQQDAIFNTRPQYVPLAALLPALALVYSLWQQQLAGLPQLSLGDFAVAARQARLMGKREGALTPEKLFSVLKAEVQAKRIEGESRPMGFLATLQ